MSEPEGSTPSAKPGVGQIESQRSLEEVLRERAPDLLPEILKALPDPQKARLAALSFESRVTRISPLPDPEELARYNAILPGGADRIMKMVEAQSAHRLSLENLAVKSQESRAGTGQWMAFIIVLVFGGLATYAAVNGQPWFGSVIGGTTLGSIVTVFIYDKRQRKQDLSQKRESMGELSPKADKKKLKR